MSDSARGHSADLNEQVSAARRRLGESITAAARLTPERVMVWGQFADAPARALQTGIYGTSAAVAVLASRSRDMTSTVRLLPGVTKPSAAEFDVSDLLITHKASAIVGALGAAHYDLTRDTEAYRCLLAGVIDGQGWGHHAVPGEPEAPSALATAQALIALASVHDVDETSLAGPASWLVSRILDDGSLSILELSFSVIALARLQGMGIGVESADAMRHGATVLRNWFRREQSKLIAYEEVHYWVPKPGEQRNHHVTFPVQVITGIALLLSGSAVKARTHLDGLARRLCRAVETDGGLRSSLTERVGIVDIGLVDQFFVEYLALESSSGPRRRAVFRVMRAGRTHRVVVFLGLVTVAFWSWRVATGESGAMSVSFIANVAFALATGVLGSMAYSRWER
ncbi:hypothetical protein ACQEVI_17855 [Promicromonospora sp. CA-289599]|uniref:hypothetical protein n=1 Tax=Promicromonospora sp. CA-289599 TaxID=3240014 RepID=UPI003D90C9A7